KYQALAFWLDPGKRDANTDARSSSGALVGAATDSSSATVASSPPFSSPPPPLTTSGQDDGFTAPALLPAGEAFDNLDVDFMAGDGEWVCSTRLPLLSPSECSAIINEAEEKASAAVAAAVVGGGGGGGGWGTSRHYAVPTTDVAVRELPRTLAWFNRAMRTRIGPTVAVAAGLGGGLFERPGRRSGSLERSPPVAEPHAQDEDFPARAVCSAADSDEAAAAAAAAAEALRATALVEPENGQERRQVESGDDQGQDREAEEPRGRAGAPTPPPPALMLRRLRVHDAFVVRYDAAAQRSLPLHTDQGELSLTISLNGTDEYEGGGTWFEGLGRAVRPEEAGHVVVFP
ncbi:unnamed protein product, partial [Ectocarpus sp. 8 AP-2014]